MSQTIPIEYVKGADEVTLWLWPNGPDPVTVRMEYRAWAKLERKAEEIAGGDVGEIVGALLQEDVMGEHL